MLSAFVTRTASRVASSSPLSSSWMWAACSPLATTAPLALVAASQPFRGLHMNSDRRLDYFVLRDRPLGPHKILAPGVKFNNRVGKRANYRHVVHYPKDGKYTIKKLDMTKLGGRDPVTGRKVIEGVGGGSKRKYRWIDWQRLPADWDPEGPELVERVITVSYDPNRDAKIMLTAFGDKMRWQIATSTVKAGDLIRTTGKIPAIPVKPVEGDSYPLGALPAGTTICLVQWVPGTSLVECFHGKDSGTILRKVGNRVVIKSANKLEYSLEERCQCVVGEVSIHPLKECHIGSPNRLRWLGYRPRSGLWKRKGPNQGKRNKKPPPVKEIVPKEKEKDTWLLLNHMGQGVRGLPRGKKRIFKTATW